MFCQPGIVKYFKEYDYVIINCGHHPSAHRELSYSQYSSLVVELFAEINKQYPPQGLFKLFWVENVAIPLHQDHNVIEYQDWRTYHRLLLFDSIAKATMARSPRTAHIIPAFQSTMALFDKVD